MLHALIRRFNPELIVESGTYRGQSAVVLSHAIRKHAPDATLVTMSPNIDDCLTVARNRLQTFEFAEVREGYSQELIPEILQASTGKRIGVFMDGPKGHDDAFDEVLRAIDVPSQIEFIAIHDCQFAKPTFSIGEYPNARFERLRIERWFQKSEISSTHQLRYLPTPWVNEHREVWTCLSPDAPGQVKPHFFSNSPQLSATAALAVIHRV